MCIFNLVPIFLTKGGHRLTMSYFDNFDNKFLNKYEKILKILKIKIIYKCDFSTYRLMVIQMSCNLVIV
jgi:hypothetical protein